MPRFNNKIEATGNKLGGFAAAGCPCASFPSFGRDDETVPAERCGAELRLGALSVAGRNIIEYLMKSHNNIDINTYGIAAPNKALELHGSPAA